MRLRIISGTAEEEPQVLASDDDEDQGPSNAVIDPPSRTLGGNGSAGIRTFPRALHPTTDRICRSEERVSAEKGNLSKINK